MNIKHETNDNDGTGDIVKCTTSVDGWLMVWGGDGSNFTVPHKGLKHSRYRVSVR